jgi:hypothetical protein
MKDDERAPIEQMQGPGGMGVDRFEIESDPDRAGDCWLYGDGRRMFLVRPDLETEARWWAQLEAAWARNSSRQADQEAER